jgi:hypothetical protein
MAYLVSYEDLVGTSLSVSVETAAAAVHKIQQLQRSGIKRIKIFDHRGRQLSVHMLVSHAIAESKPARN